MEIKINPKYPSVTDLRKRAMVKMPKFAFEYLDGGCNEDINLDKNRTDLQKIELAQQNKQRNIFIIAIIILFGFGWYLLYQYRRYCTL